MELEKKKVLALVSTPFPLFCVSVLRAPSNISCVVKIIACCVSPISNQLFSLIPEPFQVLVRDELRSQAPWIQEGRRHFRRWARPQMTSKASVT